MSIKFVRIVAAILVFGACFNANNSNASYKKHCEHKKNCNKPKDLSLGESGPIIGIAGDFGFSIIKDDSFIIPTTATQFIFSEDPTGTPNGSIPTSTFHSKHDYAYGGNLSYGYLASNNMETNLELAYHQIKNMDKDRKESFIKSDIVSLMVNGVYYAKIHNSIQPYINLGVGISRTNANGEIISTDTTAIVNINNNLTFSNLRAFKPSYQAGLGLSTELNSAILGIGYKFFGVADINDNDNSFSNLRVSTNFTPEGGITGSTLTMLNSENFKFGTLNNQIHNVSVFLKKII